MPSAVFKYQIDLNRTGSFTGPNEDITAYVQDAQWSIGFKKPYQSTSDEMEMRLTVNNHNKYFSPEYSSSPLYGQLTPQTPIRIQSVYNGGTVTHWRGWLDRVEVDPAHGHQARIIGTGPKQYLQEAEVQIALMTDVTADEIITAVMEQVSFPPALGNAWLLGLTDHSELGETTYFPTPTDAGLSLETGVAVFPYAGDNWADGIDAWRAIETAVSSERGRFFYDRTGLGVFWNREHLQYKYLNDGTVTNEIIRLNYSYGDYLANQVRVSCYPRTASATNDQVLWRTEQRPFKVNAGTPKHFRIKFTEDSTDIKIAATDLVIPNTTDGSLVYSEAIFRRQPRITNWAPTAKGVDFDIEVDGDSGNSLISTVIVRGKKLTAYDKLVIEAIDELSISTYGRRSYEIDLPLLDDDEFADLLANYELERRKNPRGYAYSITVMNRNATILAQQLAYTVGTRIRISETQTAHTGDYIIIGEEHTVLKDGDKHVTTWYLEPAEPSKFWLLGRAGYGELGQQTVMGL